MFVGPTTQTHHLTKRLTLTMKQRLHQILLFFLLILFIGTTTAFAPLGIGALLFKPNVQIVKSSDGDEDRLVDAGKFFVDAFW